MASLPPDDKDTNGLLTSLLDSVAGLEESTEVFRVEVRDDLGGQRKEIKEFRAEVNEARLEDVKLLTELQGQSKRNTEDIKELRTQTIKWRWGEGIVATVLTAGATALAFLRGK